MSLSVIIPVYNEKNTIEIIIEKVLKFNNLTKEIIVVDDCSDDGTTEIIKKLKNIHPEIKHKRHETNSGKGAAIKTGIELSKNEIVLIQDADLEYDPEDYDQLLKPILDGKADIVYGSRFLGGGPVRIHLFWNFLANKLLTLLTLKIYQHTSNKKFLKTSHKLHIVNDSG